ncbi:MAG: YciI family protein [Acidimicrobiia bacterium]
MQYLLMICTDESAPYGTEDPEVATKEYMAFGEEMGARGVLVGGARLRPTSDATTVRIRNGEVLTTDGPFAETVEQIGGYYLVECADLDEAIGVAVKIPGARHGSIEVRPVWEM